MLEADFSLSLPVIYISLENPSWHYEAEIYSRGNKYLLSSDKLQMYQTNMCLTTIHYKFHSNTY